MEIEGKKRKGTNRGVMSNLLFILFHLLFLFCSGTKNQRYISWLELDLIDYPDDTRTLYYLGYAHFDIFNNQKDSPSEESWGHLKDGKLLLYSFSLPYTIIHLYHYVLIIYIYIYRCNIF